MYEYIFGLTIILIASMGLAFLIRVDRKNRRQREAQERQEQNHLHRESMTRALEQDERGERLYQAIMAANDNRPSKGWKVSVGRIKNNGGAYSVIVQKRDSDGTAVGCGMQFDVRPERLHYFLSFHEDGDMTPTQFEDFIELATGRVSAIA